MFGDRLSELLDEKNISQKEFAKMLNIAPTTLNGYIRNRRQPDFDIVKDIARALDVSTDCLLGYSGEQVLSVQESSLINKLRGLTKEQREMIYDLVDITAKKNK